MLGFKFDKREFKEDSKNLKKDVKVGVLALVEMIGSVLENVGRVIQEKVKS